MAAIQILFVQGGGKGTHDEWDNKLVASLQANLGQGFEIQYPRMPNEDEPNYDTWKAALEGALQPLRDGVVVVAHSIGATILLKALSEYAGPRTFGAVLLIAAPFIGDNGWPADEMQFPPELGANLPKGVPVHFFHGADDETAPVAHVDLYARVVPQARVHRLPGRDHQLNDDLREVATVISSLDLE